jgi:hypothetical protein
VTTTTDAGLLGASDADHLAYALASRRVVVPHDPDFLALAHTGREHAGIAYCDQERASVGSMVRMLLLLWEVLTPEDMTGHIEYL